MKKQLIILSSILLLAGCHTKPQPIYLAERPHEQTGIDDLIRQSNRFPDPQHRDTYFWYQQHTIRSTRLGQGYEGSGQPELSFSREGSGVGFGGWGGYGGYGFGAGAYGGYSVPGYSSPFTFYPVLY
jgi:hypothetical protein